LDLVKMNTRAAPDHPLSLRIARSVARVDLSASSAIRP
jgi:hypothetical protein